MKKILIILGAILGVILLVVVIVAASVTGRYNGFVTTNEQIDASWAQVENVLQRRADLIPNLVSTVQGFAEQEKGIFEEVANARSRLLGASSPAQAAAANAGLTLGLGRLLAISEAYPELKSNENFIRLQDELAGSENRIAVERRRYNDAVRVYNTDVRQVPNNLIAGMFGFGDREYFEAEEGAQAVPVVEF